MGYIERNLMPGEKLLLRPRYHSVRFLPGVALLLVAGALAVASFVFPGADSAGTISALLIAAAGVGVAGFVTILWRAFVDSFDEFGLSTVRVFKKTGFLKRVVRQIPLDKVQDVNISATLWGRWLSYGDVELQTAGTDGTVVFPRIAHPEGFRNALFAHLHPVAGPTPPPLPSPSGPAPSAAAPSVESRLRELSRLKDAGLVTEEEYAEKRRLLLQEL